MTIEVIVGADGRKGYAYAGKYSPYSVALTIGEIIQGLPDSQTARRCLTDIMATLAEYESAKGYSEMKNTEKLKAAAVEARRYFNRHDRDGISNITEWHRSSAYSNAMMRAYAIVTDISEEEALEIIHDAAIAAEADE